jgi:hypothetical protein
LGEIDLYKPGFVGVHPADARKLDIALRKFAASISGKARANVQSPDATKDGTPGVDSRREQNRERNL